MLVVLAGEIVRGKAERASAGSLACKGKPVWRQPIACCCCLIPAQHNRRQLDSCWCKGPGAVRYTQLPEEPCQHCDQSCGDVMTCRGSQHSRTRCIMELSHAVRPVLLSQSSARPIRCAACRDEHSEMT